MDETFFYVHSSFSFSLCYSEFGALGDQQKFVQIGTNLSGHEKLTQVHQISQSAESEFDLYVAQIEEATHHWSEYSDQTDPNSH